MKMIAEKKDKAGDKKAGLKEGSKKDMATDKKKGFAAGGGVPPMPPSPAGGRAFPGVGRGMAPSSPSRPSFSSSPRPSAPPAPPAGGAPTAPLRPSWSSPSSGSALIGKKVGAVGMGMGMKKGGKVKAKGKC